MGVLKKQGHSLMWQILAENCGCHGLTTVQLKNIKNMLYIVTISVKLYKVTKNLVKQPKTKFYVDPF